MFEITLSLDFKRQKILNSFYKQMSLVIKRDSGVIVKYNGNGKSYLVIAADDGKREYIKAKILEFIVRVIEKEFKYNYLKEKIEIKTEDKLNEAFFRAISYFDEEIDREIISENIEFSNEIIIESLYYFKLQELTKRWEKTANIINQNLIMASNFAMTEVIKYLCSISENKVVNLDLKFLKKQIKMKNMLEEKVFKFSYDGISNLFAEIIKLNPMKINISENDRSGKTSEITSTLIKVFSDKVYFVWIFYKFHKMVDKDKYCYIMILEHL